MRKRLKTTHVNNKIETTKFQGPERNSAERRHEHYKIIEDKLTEEKLKYTESAAHANTPWAPSGPERIEVAFGKVPLWASGARMLCRR